MSGAEHRRPTALAPDAQILTLAVAIADHTVVDAVRSRLGYLRKATLTKELIRAIEAAARVSPRCLQRHRRRARSPAHPPEHPHVGDA